MSPDAPTGNYVFDLYRRLDDLQSRVARLEVQNLTTAQRLNWLEIYVAKQVPLTLSSYTGNR